jgi:hypothetical protein
MVISMGVSVVPGQAMASRKNAARARTTRQAHPRQNSSVKSRIGATAIIVAHLKEHQTMVLRSKMLAKELDAEAPAQEVFSQRRAPDPGQYRLQVDRQTKASFTTYEAAEQAGLVIKKGHPVVRVAVYDTVECINRIIELPKAEGQADK